MRLRDILMAWQQQGCPDPANFEVNLTQAPQAPQPPQASFAQLGQPAPAQPGSIPIAPYPVPAPYPAQGQQLPPAPGSYPQNPPPVVRQETYPQQLDPRAYPPQLPYPPFPQVGSPVGPATSPPPNPYANYALAPVSPHASFRSEQAPGEPLTAEQIRFQQLEAQVKHERQLRRDAESKEFYRAQFAARKAVPSEQAEIEFAYQQAANDDDEHGFAVFANGQTASRVDRLQAQFAARPSHVMAQELVGAPGQGQHGVVLGPQVSDTQAIDAARSSARAYAEQANGVGRKA